MMDDNNYVLGIEIGMKEALEKLKEIIGRLRLKEGSQLLLYMLSRIPLAAMYNVICDWI